MVNKSYKKGYMFERQIFHLFESAGFYCVRSAGSHGVFDIIAIKHGISFGVQCKYNNHISEAEKQAMLNAYEQFGIIPIYAYRMKNKPLQLICLIDNKVINPRELYKLHELYAGKALKKFIQLNGKREVKSHDR